MKKEMRVFLVFLFLILVVPMAFSLIEIKLSKSEYQPEETLQAEMTGGFLSLKSENILLYKDNKAHSEPVKKGLTEQNGIFYFYIVLPDNEGNYSLRIENAEYLERGKIKNETIEKNIIVLYKNTSDLSINPGFIIATKKDFQIKIKSLYTNFNVTAVFEATGESHSVFLKEGIEETIKFSVPEIAPQKSKIKLGNYEIPVFLVKKVNESVRESETLFFTPREIKGVVLLKENYLFTVAVKNNGNKNITNLDISSDLDSKNLKINPSKIDLIQPNSIKIINITISVSEIDKKNLTGKVNIKLANSTLDIPIFLEITENKTQVVLPNATTSNITNQGSSCNNLGKLCKDDESCSGKTVASLEGPCCLGDCTAIKKSSTSMIVSVILIIALVLILAYITWKIIKKRKTLSPDDILKEKSAKLEKRIRQRDEEVHGKLDRI